MGSVCKFVAIFVVVDGKSVMSMFCNAMMLLLLYVHICVTRTGWKTRPRPKTIILSIKQSTNQSISLSLSLSLCACLSVCLSLICLSVCLSVSLPALSLSVSLSRSLLAHLIWFCTLPHQDQGHTVILMVKMSTAT